MISEKQMKILAFPYTKKTALICDGAVRSGKTSIMTVAFIDWAMKNFRDMRFGICGKTIGSAEKNIVYPYMAMSYARKRYKLNYHRADKVLEVTRGDRTNYFELFGGKDEASFVLIQGRTLAGVLLDEVALMPQSFVNQALARCSIDGSKLWFSCNPAGPTHWFYKEWVLKAKEKNAIRLHFRMEDNPALSEEILERYRNMFTGVFYQRYVLGEWVLAEGLVYEFSDEKNRIMGDLPDGGLWYISCDYGITNPFAALLWYVTKRCAYLVDEYYYNSRETQYRRTDEEHYTELERLVGGRRIEQIIIDPSATSMKETIYRHGKFDCRNANNDVLGGIGVTSTLLNAGMIKVDKDRCPDLLTEFGLYQWDPDKGDTPIKENDHAMDAMRYMCQTILVDEYDWLDWGT